MEREREKRVDIHVSLDSNCQHPKTNIQNVTSKGWMRIDSSQKLLQYASGQWRDGKLKQKQPIAEHLYRGGGIGRQAGLVHILVVVAGCKVLFFFSLKWWVLCNGLCV